MSIKPNAFRSAAGIVLIGALLATTLEVGASSSSELYAQIQASAAQLTAEFRREVLLELEASTRPDFGPQQDAVATAQATAEAQDKYAQEDS